MTNVITVYQPSASLIMAGVKTWETRGNPPNGDMRPEGVRGLPGRRVNAGDRILIHAARTWAPGWLRWYSPERSDADSDRLNVLESVGVDFHECGDNWWKIDTRSLPLGAILGSVRVLQVLPIVGPTGPLETPEIVVLDDGQLTVWYPTSGAPGDEPDEIDISDQVPFGNWEPGGWAWELVNPIRTTAQCPACDGSGSVPARDPLTADMTAFGEPLDPCPACDCEGVCPPIPVKGKQGVWEWTA